VTSPPVWLHHEASLAHDIPGHPERPDRLRALEAAMERGDWFGWERAVAPRVSRDALLAVHPASHVDFIESLCARGGGNIDLDTACVPATWEAALRAAGGACAVVDSLLDGDASSAFAALRPPGHHAEPGRAMGFCFFNNVAVAARHAQRQHGVERVLIFDWDVHHGNGTEAVFWTDPTVLFVSAHQWPLYPGTGAGGDIGDGEGAGYTVNVPVPSGTGDDAYLSITRDVVCELVSCWRPGLVLVSAGFDAHHLDPLASCRVTEAGFAGMTALLRLACAEADVPLGFVLEGGYSLEALTASVTALAPLLSSDDLPDEPAVALHPVVEPALLRLSELGLTRPRA
jgi:acetoin utilization deacetylase AcuC-like enzyme